MSALADVCHQAEILTVDMSLLPPGQRSLHAAIVASLPQLFRPEYDSHRSMETSCIRAIDATTPSWPLLAGQALAQPVRGILLITPTVIAVADVADLAVHAESTHCPVVVATPFPYDETIQKRLNQVRSKGEELSFIDSLMTTTEENGAQTPKSMLHAGLLAQLTAISTITGPVADLNVNYETDIAYSAVGLCGEATVMLAGLVSATPALGLRVDLVGARNRHTISLAAPFSTISASILSHRASGTTQLPLSYESGMRNAWRNLHAAVMSGQPIRYGLRELIADLDSVPAVIT